MDKRYKYTTEEMKSYEEKLSRYNSTIRITYGCGDRAQGYIDSSYKELKQSYEALSEEEKKNVTLPKLFKSFDDGTFGMSSAFGALGSYMNKGY